MAGLPPEELQADGGDSPRGRAGAGGGPGAGDQQSHLKHKEKLVGCWSWRLAQRPAGQRARPTQGPEQAGSFRLMTNPRKPNPLPSPATWMPPSSLPRPPAAVGLTRVPFHPLGSSPLYPHSVCLWVSANHKYGRLTPGFNSHQVDHFAFLVGGGCLCSFPHLSTAPFFFGLGPLTEAETRTGCRCVSGASRGQEGARGPEARSLQVQVSVHLAAAETPGGPGGVGWPGSTCHASLEG